MEKRTKRAPKTAKTVNPIDLRAKARRGGFYFVNNNPFVSVTNILSVLDKPALKIWYGQCVYRAMVADPTIDEKTALDTPWQISGQAKNRGTTVHSIVENYVHSKEHIASVPEKYRGYAEAFYSFVEDYNIEVIANEKTVFSKEYGFAGTLDMLVKSKDSNKYTVLDVKTGQDLYPEVQLQLSAYKQGLKELGKDVGMAAILLCEDGSYKYHRYTEDLLEVFLACKKIWDWRNKKMIDQVMTYLKND